MGKAATQVKSNKEDELDDYDSKIDEMYRPFLIHSTTYVILTDQILTLMPYERNILLTMNEYDLSDINPMHPNTDDSPTHIIIFCIRFVSDDIFQPIGGLLIYKYEDQSVLLAECLKAYINDLWKLGLYVVATVSPPFETFKGILNHLVDIKNFNTYAGIITYSVAPFKEIVHVYDIQFLLVKLQNLFKEGDIKFIEGAQEYRATWNDISLVLNLSIEFKILSNYLLNDKNISRRVHIFSQQIFEQFLEFQAQGVLSPNAGGSGVLLNCVRTFLQFTELDLVDLNLMCKIDGWDVLIHILRTMTFQTTNKRTFKKKIPSTIHTVVKPSTRRRIDFNVEENVDIERLAQNMEDNLLINEQEEYFESNCLKSIGKSIQTTNNCEMETAEHKFRSEIGKKVNQCNSNNKIEEIDPIDNNQKKGKKKKGLDKDNLKNKVQTNTDQSAFRLGSKLKIKKQHLNKPYEKPGKLFSTEKMDSTLMKKEKTDSANQCTQIDKTYENPKRYPIQNKLCHKTDNSFKSANSNKSGPNKYDNNVDLSCDKDKNNNSDENLQENDTKKIKNITAEINCDSKIKNKKNRKKVQKENFDIVINDAQKFFECFSDYNCLDIPNNSAKLLETKSNNSNQSQNLTENDREKCFRDIQGTSGKSTSMKIKESKCKNLFLNDGDHKCPESFNDFCSQSDEETENCITKSCDKVPTIIELLSNVANKEKPPDEFEENNVTSEMLSTVTGMKKLMENLVKRRVKIAKPDAFVVEHIDFLVSIIKRDKNKINPVYYYGHNYGLLNAELAFVTLQNNNGLYLVSK